MRKKIPGKIFAYRGQINGGARKWIKARNTYKDKRWVHVCRKDLMIARGELTNDTYIAFHDFRKETPLLNPVFN